ncbi:MAG: hypothetical protein ACFFAS_07535 [Promethearchaeota archaeon]
MRYNRIIVSIFLFSAFFLAITGFYGINTSKVHNEDDNNTDYDNKMKVKASWVENFIYINNNFSKVEQIHDWCSGYGNTTYPYIIENLTIDGAGSESCLLIENTRVYFEIRDCMFSNARIAVKIINATNFNIFNTTIFNLRGLDGNDGIDATTYANGTDGIAGTYGIGINLIECENSTLSSNNIYDIQGGTGGNGGNAGSGAETGEPGALGGNGGNGGNAVGIFINNSNNIHISDNKIFELLGGVGGNGGNGAKGGAGESGGVLSFGESGGAGGAGGAGGNVVGITFLNSQRVFNYQNEIYSNVGGLGGNGGIGGKGGNLGDAMIAGWGGTGGYGGIGGMAIGIELELSRFAEIDLNDVFSNIGGQGGVGGDGGEGGDSTAIPSAGIGGFGGFGGIGGTGSGVYFITSQNVSNTENNVNSISGGEGGLGGNGGDGGSGNTVPESGQRGFGGDGGPGGISVGCHAFDSNNITNLWNKFENMDFGLGGDGGSPGSGTGGYYPGYPGFEGTIYGFKFENTNNSMTYLNTVCCQNNTDTGFFNEWDNGYVGNFWSCYTGEDINPIDGFGDDPYVLNATNGSQDNKPILYEFEGDYDGDGLTNLEEAILGSDGYITNMTDSDSDGDSFSDFIEFDCSTNPLNGTWYPMPNLVVSRFLFIPVSGGSELIIALEVVNNGIWNAEGVNVVIRSETQDLTLFDGIIDLDVDKILILEIIDISEFEIGSYTLNATIDPFNLINEQYSAKNGSLRADWNLDNNVVFEFEVTDNSNPGSNGDSNTEIIAIAFGALAILVAVLGTGFIVQYSKRKA